MWSCAHFYWLVDQEGWYLAFGGWLLYGCAGVLSVTRMAERIRQSRDCEAGRQTGSVVNIVIIVFVVREKENRELCAQAGK